MKYEILLYDKGLDATAILVDGDSIGTDDNFVYVNRNMIPVAVFNKDKIMFIRENAESNMPLSE